VILNASKHQIPDSSNVVKTQQQQKEQKPSMSDLVSRLAILEQKLEELLTKDTSATSISPIFPLETVNPAVEVAASAPPPPPPLPPMPSVGTLPVMKFKRADEPKLSEIPTAAEAAEPSMSDVLRELSRVQRKVVDMIR
jgi:predicted CopG family antitoxin